MNDKKKKILVIGLGDNIGGIETFYMSYYRKIKDDYNIDFAYYTPTIVFKEEIEKGGGKTYKLANMKRNPFKYARELTKIINKNNYDIIHINMLSAANILPVLIAKKAHTKKIILHSHNSNMPKGILRKILANINRPLISRKKIYTYLACSNIAGKWLFGGKTEFLVIKNAIDTNRFKYNSSYREKIRDKYSIKKHEIVIGHIGRFSEAKNHEFIIDMFKDIVDKNSNYKLMLIGKGELEEKIKKLVSKYNLEDKVIFIGSVENTNEYYNAFDIFILPSLFEGLPIVGIEAQTNGVPCLFSSDITKELHIQKNVEFIEIGSTKKWSKLILQQKYDRLNNLDAIKKAGYDIENETDKLKNIYNC